MKKYGMFIQNGKDLIHITHQNTLKEAKQYFAKVKQMSIKEFNKIFIVTEINR
jgi:hypothetical protein|tara:strand:- start:302 stop:460 length:159 start_codon:yes stop_codon:yes gene_type:complete